MSASSPRGEERRPLLAVDVEDPGLPSWADDQSPHHRLPITPARPSTPAPTSSIESRGEECCCGIDPLLCWFRVFHWVGGLIATFASVANIVYVQRVSTEITLRDAILRAYLSLFCVIIAGIQFQIPFVLRAIEILHNWTYRGLFLVYLGLNTLTKEWEHLHIEDVGGLTLLCLGSAYVIMGLGCVQSVEDRRMKRSSYTYSS